MIILGIEASLEEGMNITTCPSCGSPEITKLRRNRPAKSRGKAYVVPALEYYECPDCGEKVYDQGAMRKIESYSPVFQKRHVEKKIA